MIQKIVQHKATIRVIFDDGAAVDLDQTYRQAHHADEDARRQYFIRNAILFRASKCPDAFELVETLEAMQSLMHGCRVLRNSIVSGSSPLSAYFQSSAPPTYVSKDARNGNRADEVLYFLNALDGIEGHLRETHRGIDRLSILSEIKRDPWVEGSYHPPGVDRPDDKQFEPLPLLLPTLRQAEKQLADLKAQSEKEEARWQAMLKRRKALRAKSRAVKVARVVAVPTTRAGERKRTSAPKTKGKAAPKRKNKARRAAA